MPQTIDLEDQSVLTYSQILNLQTELGYEPCGERRRMRYPTRYLPCLLRENHGGHHSTVWPGQATAEGGNGEQRLQDAGELLNLNSRAQYAICAVIRRLRNPERYLPCVRENGHIGNHRTTVHIRGTRIQGNELNRSTSDAIPLRNPTGTTTAVIEAGTPPGRNHISLANVFGTTTTTTTIPTNTNVETTTPPEPSEPSEPVEVSRTTRLSGAVSPTEVADHDNEFCDLCGDRGVAEGRKNLGGIMACWNCLEYPSADAFTASCNEIENGALCRLRGEHAGPHQYAAAY